MMMIRRWMAIGEEAQRGDKGKDDDDDEDDEGKDDDDDEDGYAAQRGDEGSALWGLDAASRGEYSIGFRSFQRKMALPGSHLHMVLVRVRTKRDQNASFR